MLRACAGALVVFVAGCASPAFTGIPDHWPADWPQLGPVPLTSCPNITGTYVDFGTSVYVRADPSGRSLSRRLLQHPGVAPDTPVRITQKSDDELHVQVVENTGRPTERVLSRARGDFECDAEGLWVQTEIRTQADATGYARSVISMGFRPAEGGVLAGQHRHSNLGLALWIIPVPGNQRIWYRWEPAK